MPLEIPEGITVPPGLPFDPNHPHLLSVAAFVANDQVDWWFDARRFEVSADWLEERGLSLEASRVRSMNVRYDERYSEGWGRAVANGNRSLLHYYRIRDHEHRQISTLCEKWRDHRSYLYVAPWSRWVSEKYYPNRCRLCLRKVERDL